MPHRLLNPKQLEAIEHGNGPLLIIAGAGTGKTTVVTERINHLIVDKNVKPSGILALTFTDKASFEMQERIDEILPYGYTNLWIHTFHGFCDRVLRDDAHTIGLDPGYKLMSETESILLFRQHIFDLGLKLFRPLGNPTKFLEALRTHFSRLKDEDVTPNQYLSWASSLEDKIEAAQYVELANAYKAYEDIRIKESVMDFSDLISNTLLLFRTRKNVLDRYKKQFEYILVDEFQDTNFAQNELAMLLTNEHQNINVVADDDQSIYRFRGAAVSNVLQFKKNFPTAKVVTLTENYRSTQNILDSAYALIQHNNPNRLEVVEQINKKLVSQIGKSKDDIEFIHTLRAEDEADEIARKILELTKKTYKFNNIAILVRANNHAQGITSALTRYQIPFQFLGPGYLFAQEEIKDLIAYIMFLTNLSDSVSLFRVLSMNIFEIPDIELNYLLNFAKKKNLTLFESLLIEDLPFLKAETNEKVKKFTHMVENHLRMSKKEHAGRVLYYFLVDSGLYNHLQNAQTPEKEKEVQNIAKFFDRTKKFETERPDSTIYTLAEWLTLMLQMGDSPTAADVDMRDKNAVNILTIHSSKGLEFEVVFMVNLVSERFPSRERSEKIPLPLGIIKETLPLETDFHMEEERRLFYVGMTRAKQKLYFSAADYYGSEKRTKKISPFIYEALPLLLKEKFERVPSAKQLSLSDILSPYDISKQEHITDKETKQPFKLSYITYSNLQMFDICPLHYKAKVIFNIPTPTASVQSFGISLHNTLYNFYRLVNEGQTPSLEDMLLLLKREWISEGYENKKHEEERKHQARRILEDFYKTECNPPAKPLALELPFSITLKNGVKVFGKIDRVDKKGDGIEIIDYKTGENNPKAKKAHELQLAMYALAATKVKDEVLNHEPHNITLTLHFLEGNTKESMTFTQERLVKLEDELLKKIEEIEHSNFACSKNVLCVNCEYKMLCNSH